MSGIFNNRATVAAAMLVVPGAAFAQSEPSQDIVVTGNVPPPAEEVRRYVASISTSVEGQLARFHEPVCPDMVGLQPKYAAMVVARFRRVAREAGIPVGADDCRPNVLLVVAPDGAKFVEGLRKLAPGAFVGIGAQEMRRLLRPGDAVRMWRVSEVQNEDGRPMSGGLESASMRGYTNTLLVRSASILNSSTQQATHNSVIVFEDAATLGKSLRQLADYAALRTLAGARPPSRELDADTILALFDAGTPPASLTAVDLAYLREVYRVKANQPGTTQRNSVSRGIVRESVTQAP